MPGAYRQFCVVSVCPYGGSAACYEGTSEAKIHNPGKHIAVLAGVCRGNGFYQKIEWKSRAGCGALSFFTLHYDLFPSKNPGNAVGSVKSEA